ncbi:hypothetical protein SCHPADRAFT_873402 [Schizopora paradoxa]|uniref:DNA mismatch repair proteins mutS family domain-containing protein n=1 Tax=Schizopora paradoxa TaxID=27342 RepID=A0A0H2SAS7_9AGAM|nr:hypothetical protein SCHPADRAFT_873402 [Schizopora paradoxa]
MQNALKASNRFLSSSSRRTGPRATRCRLQAFQIDKNISTAATNDAQSTIDDPVVKTVTKKAFSELPKVEGQKSIDLPSWDGGLRLKIEKVEVPVKMRENDDPTNLDNLTSKRTRRKRAGTIKEHKLEGSERTSIKSSTFNERSATDSSPLDAISEKREPRKQLAEEIRANLARFPDCILLTRVGQFYESIFDQAQEVAALLSIKLAKRSYKEGVVWLCGFPLAQLDKHLRTLVEKHHRPVALCEEFMKHRGTTTSKPSFERRVVRILTPGTLIDESFINPYVNNYLLAISTPKDETVGLAWIDISTGEFSSLETSLAALSDHLVRIGPREVVLHGSLRESVTDPVKKALIEENALISYALSGHVSVIPDVNNQIAIEDSEEISERESESISLLTTYIRERLLEHTPKSLRYSRNESNDRMQIDAHTLRALEIKENLADGGATGCLMSTIKRTVTSSGTRLLSKWLSSPSASLVELTSRQDLVEIFYELPWLRQDVMQCLKKAGDAAKILQRFSLGRGDVDDLLQIKHTISTWHTIKQRILLERTRVVSEDGVSGRHWGCMDILLSKVANLASIAVRIEHAVEINQSTGAVPPDEVNEVIGEDLVSSDASLSSSLDIRWRLTNLLTGNDVLWRIKPQFSEDLDELHCRLRKSLVEKRDLESRFKEQYDAPSLSLKYSPGLGFHVHLARPRRDADRIAKSQVFHKISESASTRTYFNEGWSRIGNSIKELVDAIYIAEKYAFATLRSEVTCEATAIRRTARIIDELDVASAFATLAAEMNFVKPTFTTSNTLEIIDGRHPTVEVGLLASGRSFTSNTLSMDDSSRLHIITGPNMAGKSTYLRQIALITILAQTGSFVPAKSARLGVVDKVFSRVGAKDDLFRDRSTFMVEMLETSNILKNATERSLVIMDEVGRGTTMTDGISIAFAAICHLYYKNRCRTLFATHFHEVVDMLGGNADRTESDTFPAIRYYCTDVDETDGRFAYSHLMRPGVNRQSHGLKVAQLAGMPPLAIKIASETLSSISKRHISPFSENIGSQLRSIGKEAAQILSD